MSSRGRPAPRHRAVRSDRVARALRHALVAALLPVPVLAALAWYAATRQRGRLIDLVVSPRALLWLAIGLAVTWLVWVGSIVRSYLRNRGDPAPRSLRLVAGLCVAALCAGVTVPMGVAARYAMVQRDLIGTVFASPDSVTTPEATKEDPWGDRDRVNVLLLGGDGAVRRPGVRTDSVMLASIDTETGGTVLFSLPRNLRRVPFPDGSPLAEIYPDGFSGYGSEAEYFLNAVYRNVPRLHPGILGKTDNEGADAIKLAVSAATGLQVDYYVLVNLGGFRRLVDAIGGITVNINEPVPIGGNTDAGIPPDDWMQPGPDQRLDGYHALWYTRGRYGSTDYERMKRQRCAINAIVTEADPVTVLRRYTKLANATKKIVRTDIPQHLLSAFVDLAAKVKARPLSSVGFERSDEFNPNDPDFDYIRDAVATALRPQQQDSTPVLDPPAATDGTDGAEGDEATATTKVPSQISDTDTDCAYHPAEQTTLAAGTVG